MNFNSSWSPRYRFTSGKDNLSYIQDWGCKNKAGIYVIRDEFDSQTLYVGCSKRNLEGRLNAHLNPKYKGNAYIADLVQHSQTFNIRWAESENPGLSESAAIITLKPLFNQRCEWKDLDLSSLDECIFEGQRLGLLTSSRQKIWDNVAKNLVKEINRSSPEEYVPIWKKYSTPPERNRNNYPTSR